MTDTLSPVTAINEQLSKGDQLKAFHIAEKHFTRNPSVKLLSLYAQLAARTGRAKLTVELYQHDLASQLSHAERSLYIGHAYKTLGEIKRASSHYQTLVTSGDDMLAAIGWWSIADLKSTDPSLLVPQKIEALLHSTKYPMAKALLGFALAKAKHNEQKYAESFSLLNASNSIISDAKDFTIKGLQQVLKADRQLANNQTPASTDTGHNDTRAVFIVGLPRSGTTLIEQILGEAEELQLTDELPYINNYAKSLQACSSSNETQEFLSTLEQRYFDETAQYICSDTVSYVVDKAPNNWLHLGLISRSFSRPVIINIYRNQLDNVLANYAQYYHSGQLDSYSLEDSLLLRREYVNHIEWAVNQQHVELINISYESLVTRPRDVVAQLQQRLNLTASIDQLLNFHTSNRPVLTPSSSQVRRPIDCSRLNTSGPYRELLDADYVNEVDQLTAQLDTLASV